MLRYLDINEACYATMPQQKYIQTGFIVYTCLILYLLNHLQCHLLKLFKDILKEQNHRLTGLMPSQALPAV